MYNVLNNEGDKITVDTIDPQIHFHLSGREFTSDDACVEARDLKDNGDNSYGPELKPAYLNNDVILDDNTVRDRQTGEEIGYVTKGPDMTREQAIEAYKEKYGRKPSSQMKTENIIAKL